MVDRVLTSDVPAGFVFDPFTEGFADDPYPHYAELRAAEPVHESPFGFWILTDYEDVSALLRSGHSVDERHLAPGPLREVNQQAYGDRPRWLDGLSMLDKDPPDHTRLRRLVAKAFTPRAIDRLAPRVAALVDETLDRIAEAGEADLVTELAFPLPFAVISEMLGTPTVDHLRLRDLSSTVVHSLEPAVDLETMNRIVDADKELREIAQEMITWKRKHPADDLLSALIAAEDGGDVLSDAELVAQTLLLHIAGHETTVNLLAGGVLALLRHPESLTALRERPDLADNAVEELLRYDSPAQMSRRITVQPYRVRDREIPAGSFVIASLASANRDPKYWGPDAAELRLDRENARQHVAFGAGVHHCLGAALARMEARIAFSRLVQRFPGLTLQEVRWNGRINLRGAETLTVSV
jgi:cytochrome P450